MELVSACEVTGKKAVSCVIDGIRDASIQAGARAGRYETPDRLYAEYLSSLVPEVPQPSTSKPVKERLRFGVFQRNEHKRIEAPKPAKQLKPKVFRCYNCKDEGHSANKCPKPRVECTSCKCLGHLSKDCRRQPMKNQIAVQQSKFTNETYYFDCWINGISFKCYVDSGCSAVLVKEEVVKLLNLPIFPSTITISGYGGSLVNVVGTTKARLKVDRAEAEVEILVVPNEVQDVAVMVGQAFLHQPHIAMIVCGETVRLLPADEDISSCMNIESRKIPLWAKCATVIPARTKALLAVTSRDNYDGEVFIHGGLRLFPGKEHLVEDCITNAADGFLSMINLLSIQELLVMKFLRRECSQEKEKPKQLVIFQSPRMFVRYVNF